MITCPALRRDPQVWSLTSLWAPLGKAFPIPGSRQKWEEDLFKSFKLICLIIIQDFLWQSFWIYACLSCGFVKIESCRFCIFCCWCCGRKKYWIPDNFTICISVNLIGSSSKTNADHLSPFCSSNSQYSMFQMFFPDGPTPLSPTADVRSHNFQPILKTLFFRVTYCAMHLAPFNEDNWRSINCMVLT